MISVRLVEFSGSGSPHRQRRGQGRGKVFYVGGAVGGGSQFLRINITPNRNRKSCYSLRTFMRSC